jgi:hypothetical protein
VRRIVFALPRRHVDLPQGGSLALAKSRRRTVGLALRALLEA